MVRLRRVVVALVGASLAFAPGVARAQDADRTPSPLPADFGLGVLAPQGEPIIEEWMAKTGVPWTYAYEYLAGGVNTKAGWETWSPGYPLTYANRAAEHGYTPVFIYDQLLGNEGECETCDEYERRLTSLNDPELMADYYDDFTRAMRYFSQGGVDGLGFGARVIVDVEPHLSGTAHRAVADEDECYGFCTGEGADPALLKASVRSSGNEDVAEFDDTYRGFNAAMLHIRDTYAPNVKLAFHVSSWAVEKDLSLSDDPTLDGAEIGDAVGSFAARSGTVPIRPDVSTYDVLFHDLDWADAGYHKYVQEQDPAFWDRKNVQFPNFRRWLRWVGAITARTGLDLIVHNVPVGNQSHVAVDNTQFHYQDNRAEYFFAHIDELRDAGIAGLLFGSATTGATVAWDASKDGVHEPERPACTTDGDSSGERICPTIRTSYTDDDGGFLRTEAARFYGALDASSFPVVPVAAGAGVLVLAGTGVVLARRRRQPTEPDAAATQPTRDSIASGRFEVVRPIGEGAMKQVFLARDTLLDRDVALAMMRTDDLDDQAVARAMREVRALARLGDHPHVVTVHDTGEQEGRPYFVCQYLSGGSVRDVLRSRGAPGPTEAIRLTSEVCEALAYAHDAGIIHRDVKPGNVLLDERGRALLGDFGIAAAADRTQLTATGAVLGTVAYMAPEQARGEPVPASDMYALGAMFYELICGAPPFTGNTMAVLHQHLHAQPPVPSATAPQTPVAVDRLVLDLLAKDPDARPDAHATLARLREIEAATGRPDAAGDVLLETMEATREDVRTDEAASPSEREP
jgi:tRNA A-37 threonylcarbamoyl transferase component Bud32